MSGYTKGPWTIDKYGQVEGPDGRSIAINGVSSVCSPGPAQDVAKANARLIAAAPMLLEGAIDAVEAFKLLRIGMADEPKAIEVIDAHISELEYAIAAACQGERG